ncbi:MAG: CarD family transcriptional regulator [Oscillospiraceae bacterium]|nr:CarD family transcriptional regulator [Oscillospiraceae bacterium]
MIFNLNDTVLYSTHGVCKISEIIKRQVNDKLIEYYVLKPIFDKKSTFYVPVNSKKATAKMRTTLSAEEIYDLLESLPDIDTEWIENNNARKERFSQIISNGTSEQLLRLIKTLYLQQQEQNDNGKKLHITDERFLKDAEKMLYGEFAYVLNMEHDQVLPMIVKYIETT